MQMISLYRDPTGERVFSKTGLSQDILSDRISSHPAKKVYLK